MQRAEVMSLDGLGEVSEELEQCSGRLGGQLGIHTIGRSLGCMERSLKLRQFLVCTGVGVTRRSFLRLFETIALAREGEDFGLVHESIDESDDAAGVGEDLVPFAEGLVGGEDDRTVLVSGMVLRSMGAKSSGSEPLPPMAADPL
jgi:hypothetical protein